MTKRALCVGVNDYPLADMDLKGCVNDANDWASALVDHYDFTRSDVTMLLDRQATKATVLRELGNLLAGAKRGDVLVFTNSSHGTYVADSSGDEAGYDEAMCPYDAKDNLLIDDDLRTLFADLPAGVRLVVVSDSCFSGTVTREPGLPTPDDRRRRFLQPDAIGLRTLDNPHKPTHSRTELYPESSMTGLLLSGCSDRQYSYDAKINGRYNGAMTASALSVLQQGGWEMTYSALHRQLVDAVSAAGYEQTPQLEGRSGHKRRHVFR
ncbi:MAG TPA: caspase family protein [Dermatophilaceae bacterium]|nr:caspase family protein [Dermatophilaceae bacterium]